MKKTSLYIIIISILLIASKTLFSQAEPDSLTSPQKVLVTMKNGDEFRGEILRQDEQTLVLKTVNGELHLKMAKIESIEEYNYKGKYGFANPHDTRYFFGPTGIPLKKGEGYYQNIAVSGNFVNYGITNNISIGGGLEFVSTILGEPLWFLTPKVGFDITDKVHAGGGVLVAGFAAEGSAALGYGVFTYGHSESNVSLGIGYGLANGEFSDYPAIMLSGTHRVGRSIALLSENYVFPDGDGNANYFGIQGIRILSEKNSFDIGAIIIPELFDFILALPFVGYVRVF